KSETIGGKDEGGRQKDEKLCHFIHHPSSFPPTSTSPPPPAPRDARETAATPARSGRSRSPAASGRRRCRCGRWGRGAGRAKWNRPGRSLLAREGARRWGPHWGCEARAS